MSPAIVREVNEEEPGKTAAANSGTLGQSAKVAKDDPPRRVDPGEEARDRRVPKKAKALGQPKMDTFFFKVVQTGAACRSVGSSLTLGLKIDRTAYEKPNLSITSP